MAKIIDGIQELVEVHGALTLHSAVSNGYLPSRGG
jgi:hypothetical protein